MVKHKIKERVKAEIHNKEYSNVYGGQLLFSSYILMSFLFKKLSSWIQMRNLICLVSLSVGLIGLWASLLACF